MAVRASVADSIDFDKLVKEAASERAALKQKSQLRVASARAQNGEGRPEAGAIEGAAEPAANPSPVAASPSRARSHALGRFCCSFGHRIL